MATMNTTAVLILIGSFLLMVFLRFQIAYSVAISALLCLWYQGLPLATLSQQMVKGISSFSLMAVPFFITMGVLMGSGGISEKLLNLADACVGWMTGGLAMVNIVASYFFGGISGSASADTASLGSLEIPMMVDRGYDVDFSTASPRPITIASASFDMCPSGVRRSCRRKREMSSRSPASFAVFRAPRRTSTKEMPKAASAAMPMRKSSLALAISFSASRPGSMLRIVSSAPSMAHHAITVSATSSATAPARHAIENTRLENSTLLEDISYPPDASDWVRLSALSKFLPQSMHPCVKRANPMRG